MCEVKKSTYLRCAFSPDINRSGTKKEKEKSLVVGEQSKSLSDPREATTDEMNVTMLQ